MTSNTQEHNCIKEYLIWLTVCNLWGCRGYSNLMLIGSTHRCIKFSDNFYVLFVNLYSFWCLLVGGYHGTHVRPADLGFIVTFWRSPVNSYATASVECCSSSCRISSRRYLWFLCLCLRGCKPSLEHVSVALTRSINLTMNLTVLCSHISRDSMSASPNIRQHKWM